MIVRAAIRRGSSVDAVAAFGYDRVAVPGRAVEAVTYPGGGNAVIPWL